MSVNDINANEELKKSIINNLNNANKKKAKAPGNNKQQKNNKDKPPVRANKPKSSNDSEKKIRAGKPNRNAADKFNRTGAQVAEKVTVLEPVDVVEEENKIDYVDFLKSQHKIEDGEEKFEIVGVRFKPVGKIYFFLPVDLDFKTDDRVIVETSRGLEVGMIAFGNRFISAKKVVSPLKSIIRRASDEDIQRVERNKKSAHEALKVAWERIKAHGLKMKLIDAEYTFDNSKLIYYFTHEGRVDFRELVKDLASIFKIRIELRQIGTRDQTKVLGGLSICGRPFCCSSFLQDFEQVTIKMAKDQNISINSAKISGACGKLMCCLKYEHETYEQLNKDMPRPGAFVETTDGESGVVIECNALTGMCRVKITRTPNQGVENIINSYSKEQLKITGYARREKDSVDEIVDLSEEDDSVKSEVDMEI